KSSAQDDSRRHRWLGYDSQSRMLYQRAQGRRRENSYHRRAGQTRGAARNLYQGRGGDRGGTEVMKNRDIAALTDKYVAHTYARTPIALVKGKGVKVWDADGKEYLDFLAGIAVNSLGHCHPAIVRAIRSQSQRLLHVSNLYHIQPQAELARELCRHSFADRVFFCNSGAEANEAAIKLARRYGLEKLGGKYEVISTHNSFHGRTLATLTATGQEKVRAGYDPLPDGFRQVPYNDLGAVEGAIDEKKTAAILVEPIQAEGGVIVPDESYLRGLREI